MKIAICDDEKAVLKQLHEYVHQYAAENMLEYTILEFDQGQQLLDAVSQDPEIRILFLDIYLSPFNGMEIAKSLRANGNDCEIIFVTVSTDHYADSYEVGALHYLVKPVTYDRVCTALSRCRTTLAAASRCINFSQGGREHWVPLRKIRYVEVFRNQCTIHADEDIPLRCTLETVTRQISDRRFLRTHRSFLLNMEYISHRGEHDVYLKTGESIPLSRSCEKQFDKEYGRFLTTLMSGDYYEDV